MKQFIIFFCFLLSSNFPLWAETTTATNTGNVPVRVEYKGEKGDYQETHLNPGESKELPGGIEKVKLSRETHGEWAKGTKPGQEIKVDIKKGDKNVGNLNGYGDKLIFGQPTQAPQIAVQTNPPTPMQLAQQPIKAPETKPADQSAPSSGQMKMGDNQVKIATDTKAPEPAPTSKDEFQEPPQPTGTIQNTSQLGIHVTYKDSSGKVIKESVIQGGRTDKIPDGTDSVGLSENMIQSGYLWPHLARDPQVTIHHQDGKIETVKDIPPGYKRQPKNVEIHHPDYFKGAKFQFNPFRDNLKMDYKYGSNSNSSSPPASNSAPSSRNMDANFSDNIQTQTRYKF